MQIIPMRLYESKIPSGNSYKVNLLLATLGIEYEAVEVDILAEPPETRRPEFLAKNPNGRVPVLELDDGTFLPESGAILWYLAEGTPLVSNTRLGRARTLEWMFFEQYSHEPYVAVLKFLTYWGSRHDEDPKRIELLKSRGQAALDVMAGQLRTHDFFVEERYGIADIALFAYTQSAEVLGYHVAPPVRAWLERVRHQPGYVPMKRDPLGKAP
jgi:glutathione S-transferase